AMNRTINYAVSVIERKTYSRNITLGAAGVRNSTRESSFNPSYRRRAIDKTQTSPRPTHDCPHIPVSPPIPDPERRCRLGITSEMRATGTGISLMGPIERRLPVHPGKVEQVHACLSDKTRLFLSTSSVRSKVFSMYCAHASPPRITR